MECLKNESVNDMKRIFFIINCYSKGGGAESLLTSIVNHLNRDKYEIGIMEIIHDTVKKEPVKKDIKIYPYYVKADDPERKAKMYYVYHKWDQVIEKYIPQDYDLYVSFNYLKPTFLLPPGKKNIAWIHSDVYDLGQEDMAEERMLQNQAFCKADRIVAISDITVRSLMDLFPEHKKKIRVICNGIDIERVRTKAKETTGLLLRHPAIISVGRLDERKNPLRLLSVFEKIYCKNPSAHLYYLGYGELGEAVKKISAEKRLADSVHLLGYYENPFPIMLQGDLCAMFSKSEGFPMSLLESVALDVPFVSSVIGGAGILANNQRCGRVVETDEEAAKAGLEILGMDKEQIRTECRKSIERFDFKRYIGRVEELFDEVLEGK